ncbi:MAG: tRNA-dihydrouridine synthase, partial [Bacteroidia bacterium]|nr:tRNA-dihydrouridine synthase [Bacteroidia bacterium]
IGYPWIFNEIKHFLKTGTHMAKPTLENRVEVCLAHLRKSIEWKGPKLGVLEMRPHYTNYFKGISHFKDTRLKLVTLDTFEEVETLLLSIPEKYKAVTL